MDQQLLRSHFLSPPSRNALKRCTRIRDYRNVSCKIKAQASRDKDGDTFSKDAYYTPLLYAAQTAMDEE